MSGVASNAPLLALTLTSTANELKSLSVACRDFDDVQRVSAGVENRCCDNINEICDLLSGSCSPEKVAQTAAEDELRKIRDVLRVRCQIVSIGYDQPIASSRCVRRTEPMLVSLKRKFPALQANPSEIQVIPKRTCIDTVAADGALALECHSKQLYGYVPISFTKRS